METWNEAAKERLTFALLNGFVVWLILTVGAWGFHFGLLALLLWTMIGSILAAPVVSAALRRMRQRTATNVTAKGGSTDQNPS